jgi:predicted acyl esterase
MHTHSLSEYMDRIYDGDYWFPLIDRNPQTFVKNIFLAKSSDFKSATHRIHRSARAASNVAFPVVNR